MLMDERIPSFTERALLNPRVLDLLCPPNSEKLKIETPFESVLHNVIRSRINPFSSEIKTSYWHWGTKPIRFVGRILYTAIVTIAVAPMGILWHGFKTAKHLSLYTFAYQKNNHDDIQTEWKKTCQYAKAFFTDFSNFVWGSLATCFISTILIYSVIVLSPPLLLTKNIIDVFACSVFLYFPLGFFGGFDPSTAIPNLVAEENVKVGMYYSLALRNQLGLVNQNNGLIPFSGADEYKYDIRFKNNHEVYIFQGQPIQDMENLIYQAEIDLLDLVIQVNVWLQKNNRPLIPYSYPFKGKDVVKNIQNILKQKDAPSDSHSFRKENRLGAYDQEDALIQQLIHSLRIMDHKIEVLRNIYYTAKKITLEGPTFIRVARIMNKNEILIPQMKSFVNEVHYQGLFEEKFNEDQNSFRSSELETSYENLINTCSLEPLDSS